MTSADRATRARVVAAGDCSPGLLRDLPAGDLLVCVDGGLGHCLQAGLQPHWLVGDLDSARACDLQAIAELDIRHVRYPAAKNAGDLQLALELIAELNVTDVFLYGVSGGRTDHLLFNWMLPLRRSWPFVLHFEDATVRATVVVKGRPFSQAVSPQTCFSVLALSLAAGVEVAGARWPLHDATLAPGDTLGLSNEASVDRLDISIDSGLVLVMINK